MATEVEAVIVTTEEVTEVVDVVVPVQEEDKPEAAKPKTNKEPKPKKSSAPKKPASHPPYFVMIQEAITTLKDRTGSSQVAIAKFIEENQKNLPGNFRKLLLVQLKNLVAAEKLVKVKGSYKIPSASKPASPPKKKPTPASKPKAKPRSTALKKKAPSAKPKAKSVAKKVKVATPVKAKAVPRPKPKERVAKVAKTTARTTPGRKPPTARAPPAPKPVAAAKKKAPVKKAAAAKSPAKKAAAKSPAKKATTTKRGGRK